MWPNAFSFSRLSFDHLLKKSVYMSKKNTIKNLREKIQRILNYYPQYKEFLKNDSIRIWKNLKYENFLKNKPYFNEKTKILTNGTLLNDELVLEVILYFILK